MVDVETLQSMVDQTRRFVREDLIAAEEWVEKHDEIPDHIIKKLKQYGYFGMTIPEAYGGLGLSMFEEASVVCEIGYASPVFRSYFGTSTASARSASLLMEPKSSAKNICRVSPSVT